MATKKKTEKTVEKVDVEVKHSIPTAGERSSPTKSRVIDRFRAKAKPNTKAVRADERPVVELDTETQHRFVDFAAAKELFDLVEAEKSTLSKEVSRSIYEKFVDALWHAKSQPQNPAIKVKNSVGKLDAEGQFIVQGGSKIKVNMPEVGEDEQPEEALVRALTDLGLPHASADSLVGAEVSFVPQWSLNFTDLLRGEVREGKIVPPTDTQTNAAEALFCVLNGEDAEGNRLDSKGRLELLKSISEDGWKALNENVEGHTSYFPTLVDSANFLDRVCNYASSREELDAILTVFTPVYFCSRVKFAVSDSAEGKTERLLDEAKSILNVV